MLRRIYSNIGASIVFRSLGVVFTLFLNFLIAKLCGSEGYGLFYQGLAVFTVATVVFRFGVDNYSLIKVSEYHSKKKHFKASTLLKKSYKLIIPTIICLTIILFLSADLIAKYYYKDPNLATPLRLFSIAFLPFILLQINSEFLKGLAKIKLSSFYQGFLPNAISVILGTIVFYLFFDDVVGFICSYAISYWLVFMFSFFSLKKRLAFFLGNKDKEKVTSKGLLRSTKTFWTIASASVISTNIVDIVLGFFLDSGSVGVYGAAVKISLIISFILPSINSAMAPEFVDSYVKKDMKRLGELAKKSSFLMFIASTPLILILTFYSTPIITLFGDDFSSGGLILTILAWGQFFKAITGSVGFILMSTKLEKYLLLSLVLSLCLALILSIILIPNYGITGAALAVGISIAFQNLYSSYICYSKLSIVPLFFIKNSFKNE
ncbi:MAG: hypothetical protein ED556_03050 [Winogradskyella sp.]|uniref:oligosaccharide flippase family protein n=1 Tax=Winogradskyella sp. TaxID=1883156 RepID=UPI000F3D9F20|nr:oligosaccharide flippase family protein [Winogradskyella sp.]RNC88177.1 MAG: hypothetical protein ED556_03050 [Winogradskyella sp.]